MPERRWAWGALALTASGIFIATVYGRYHYLVDSLAGALVAALVLTTLPRAAGAVWSGQGS